MHVAQLVREEAAAALGPGRQARVRRESRAAQHHPRHKVEQRADRRQRPRSGLPAAGAPSGLCNSAVLALRSLVRVQAQRCLAAAAGDRSIRSPLKGLSLVAQ